MNRALYTALAIALFVLAAGVAQITARAQQPNQVGLVVDFGDGTVTTRCVEFSEQEISGYELLRRSGLPIVAHEISGMGVTICDIGETSDCSASSCFCQCQGLSCTYWRYYHLEDGTWQYSSMGAHAYTVQHGDVEGWAWAEDSASSGTQPPPLSFEEICAIGTTPTTTAPPASSTETPLPPSPTATAQSATIAATQPATIPPPTPSPIATSAPESPGSPSTTLFEEPVGYVFFGLIAAGLLAWLFLAARGRE